MLNIFYETESRSIHKSLETACHGYCKAVYALNSQKTLENLSQKPFSLPCKGMSGILRQIPSVAFISLRPLLCVRCVCCVGWKLCLRYVHSFT